MRSLLGRVAVGCLLLPGAVFAQTSEDETTMRPNKFKKWRQETPPKMVVFGDSSSDVGRRYNAPSSFQFEEYGIGAFPWKRLYDGPESDAKTAAYMPLEGSPANGKAWPTWLRVPDELNFATSSASATEAFKSRERCIGYTGEGEEYPTATLAEQIDRYFYEVVDATNDTLDYTHVIALGTNDLVHAGQAISRYSLGGVGYQDPVDFHMVFEVDAASGFPVLDDNGLPVPTFAPMIEDLVNAWEDGISALIDAGVTGRILLANVASVKGLSRYINTETAARLDSIAYAANLRAEELALKYPQVKIMDLFTLFAALVDKPSIFEDLGFVAPEGSFLADPCMGTNFDVDYAAEIMGTQALRNPDCQDECALCADEASPCQNCLEGNPSITVCDDPYTRVFWDEIHLTTEFNLVLGEAVRQCSKDSPNYDRPLVEVVCPPEVS